jgi:hypothetical protein
MAPTVKRVLQSFDLVVCQRPHCGAQAPRGQITAYAQRRCWLVGFLCHGKRLPLGRNGKRPLGLLDGKLSSTTNSLFPVPVMSIPVSRSTSLFTANKFPALLFTELRCKLLNLRQDFASILSDRSKSSYFPCYFPC